MGQDSSLLYREGRAAMEEGSKDIVVEKKKSQEKEKKVEIHRKEEGGSGTGRETLRRVKRSRSNGGGQKINTLNTGGKENEGGKWERKRLGLEKR